MADVAGSLGTESTEEWRNRYLAWSKNIVRDYYEMLRKRLASPNLISGSDLIAFGMKPGAEMGRLLAILRSSQDTGEISTREDAMALARSLLAKRT